MIVFLLVVAYLAVGYFIAPLLDKLWYRITAEKPTTWAVYEHDAKANVAWIYALLTVTWGGVLAVLLPIGALIGIVYGLIWIGNRWLGGYWFNHSTYMKAFYEKKTRPFYHKYAKDQEYRANDSTPKAEAKLTDIVDLTKDAKEPTNATV